MQLRTLGMALLAAAICLPSLKADEADSEQGYKTIFNGKDLTGWDGDKRFWSVEDGVIKGETTPDNKAPGNTFLIWQDGKLKNFHLKLKFKITTGNNSGVQYRSNVVKDFVVSGYQAEVENKPGKVGFLYHEKGRGWLVDVGKSMVIDKEGNKNVVSEVADLEWLKAQPYSFNNEWNEYHIIGRGNHIVHYLNGYPTMELIDEDPTGRLMEGILALQIHAGSPMTVYFKDIRVKQLPQNYGEAVRLFKGQDLENWTFSSDKLQDTWAVRDGVMHNQGKPAGYIRTKDDYTNYVLRLQIRHLTKGNSGVLLRMVGEDKVWPKSIEAQGQKDNLGDIWNIDMFPMQVATERTNGRHTKKAHESNERPVGEWNDYEILLDGGTLEIYVNNLLQNAATDVEEVPGKICLQSEGAELEFRNVVLIPIEKEAKAAE